MELFLKPGSYLLSSQIYYTSAISINLSIMWNLKDNIKEHQRIFSSSVLLSILILLNLQNTQKITQFGNHVEDFHIC